MMILAQLKQEDVFKSISDNVGSTADPKVLYAVMLGAVAFILLMVVLNKKKQRVATPRAVNHQGRLTRELLKRVPLKKAELKQLKIAAQEQGYESPLTLVLCPSLLAKSVNAGGKADRKTLVLLAKKMGMAVRKKEG
jgi:hypothetical protein